MRNEERNPVTSRSARSRQANIHQRAIFISSHAMSHPYGPYPTPVGFEPTRGDPIGWQADALAARPKCPCRLRRSYIQYADKTNKCSPRIARPAAYSSFFFLCVPARKSRRVSSAPRCFFVSREACRRASPVALRRV